MVALVLADHLLRQQGQCTLVRGNCRSTCAQAEMFQLLSHDSQEPKISGTPITFLIPGVRSEGLSRGGGEAALQPTPHWAWTGR
jgi:hypothetical protein